jgi:flagellar hook protein FlgE
MTFETCLSGLNCASRALDVAGDNISNSNTVGFKSSQAHFADVFAATLASARSSAVGLGASANTLVQSFKQGDIAPSNNPLDMAINGRGFFRMDDNGSTTYTRNGQFHTVGELDTARSSGATGTTYTQAQLAAQRRYVVNADGLRLTGYNATYTAANPQGVISATGTPTDILLDGNMPASATTKATIAASLDARSKFITTAFDPNNATTYTAQTSVPAYDAAGKRYDLAAYFTNTASDTWRVDSTLRPSFATSDFPLVVTAGVNDQFSIDVNGTGARTVTLAPSATGYANLGSLAAALQSAVSAAVGNGAVVKMQGNNLIVQPGTAGGTAVLSEGNGAMAAYFGTSQTVGTLTFDPNGALNPPTQNFTVALGGGLASVQLDFTGSTQYANTFSANSTVDGYGNGYMTAVNVGADGMIQGSYSNGRTRNLAQVVLANFTNPGGLIKRGDNQWIESAQSGKELLDTPANATAKTSLGLGAIQGSALESSNIDMSAEMINLITQQRYYQANAQAIKTQDSVLQTLSSLK